MNPKFTFFFFCFSIFNPQLFAQHNGEFANMGSIIKVESGAIMTIQGDVHNIGGLLSNDGFIEVQGNLYSDATFQQRGTGRVRLENNDVNVGERQFISGSYAVRGGTAATGVDDGSFYNLELANTAGFVYLVGTGNVADVRNTVDFKMGVAPLNSIITHDVGMVGAISYPANGASYSAVFGMMNPSAGLANFVDNTVSANGNMSAIDQGYIIGKLRRAIAPAGGTYNFVVGLEPATPTSARGLQYTLLDIQANTYDVIQGYFQQGSLNNAAVGTECSGYQMDDFWGDRHGEWRLTDINTVLGGDYDIRIWPQDPSIPWSGSVYTISKNDQFLWPSPNPLHNDCGPTTVGLDRGPFNGFSDFGVVSSTVFVPIDLLYITATAVNNKFIRVDWATAQEDNVDFFELQRSLDGINFQTIASKDAAGTTTTTQHYTYDDNNVLPNVNYYYRVKSVDNDASFDYTDIVVASISKKGASEEVVLYPNPISNGSVNIDIKSLSNKPAEIKIFDAIGQLIHTQKVGLLTGVNNIKINTDDFASGTYFINITGNDFNNVQELIKVNE